MKRIALLLFALVWGFLVQGTMEGLSYEHATGYAPLAETLSWAIPLAMPMLVGALVANETTGLAKWLRWLCALFLALEGGFFLIYSFIKVLAVPPFIGMTMLLWVDLPSATRPTTRPKIPVSWRKRLAGTGLGLLGLSLFMTWRWFHNPLPSDAEMIAHFNAHRPALEKLVQGYRHYRPPEGIEPWKHSYEMMPDVKALMVEAGVYHIIGAQGASGFWYPAHYSAKTIQTLRGLYWGRTIGNQATSEEVLSTLRREMPSLFDGVDSVLTLERKTRLIAVVHVSLGTLKRPYEKNPWRYFPTSIHKGYYHFPQPPRIESGQILMHDFSQPNGLGLGQRVIYSLDGYPQNWQRGECVLRQIEALWFITMCRSG